MYDVNKIRADFPILERKVRGKDLVFLDSAASSQKPKAVIEAIEKYYRFSHANVHRGVYMLSQESTDLFEQARSRVRQFLNAGLDEEIIFTRGTTESINLVASSYGQKYLKEGDQILITEMEHHSNIVPWQLAARRSGATIKVVPVNDMGELDMDEYLRLLTEKTRIVAVTHVSNTLGTVNPVDEIIQIAHDRGVPVLLDGAQAVMHSAVDVRALDVDFYAFSGHKIYGPTGIGVLYGKKEYLENMPPYQGGGEMIDRVTFEKTTFAGLPFRFEAGTPNISGSVGLSKALDYVENIGFEDIKAHEKSLLDLATQKIMEIEGVNIVGRAQNKAGVLSFNIEGAHPFDVGTLLDQMGIAVRTGHHCTQPLMDRFDIPGTVRASFAMYNTPEEVEALVRGVDRAAKMLR